MEVKRPHQGAQARIALVDAAGSVQQSALESRQSRAGLEKPESRERLAPEHPHALCLDRAQLLGLPPVSIAVVAPPGTATVYPLGSQGSQLVANRYRIVVSVRAGGPTQ